MAAQLPDWITINGAYRDLYSNPLEQYWTRFGKRRQAFYPTLNCTRGYIASWEVQDNQLFLLGIDGNYERRSILFGKKLKRFTLKTLFPNVKQKRVKADWFSGKLRVPDGKMTHYEHSHYDSRFEREIIITIHKGDLLKMVTLDYTQKILTLNAEVLITSKQEVGHVQL